MFVFCVLKNLTNWTRAVPESLYTICNNAKIKKNINRFRKLDVWEFLENYAKGELTSSYDSGTSDFYEISGWEVRFKISLNAEDLDTLLETSSTDFGSLKKELLQYKNDI